MATAMLGAAILVGSGASITPASALSDKAKPPVSVSVAGHPLAGKLTTIRVAVSLPHGDKVRRFTVAFGDHSRATTGTHLPRQLQHRYGHAGRDTVTVTVTDVHRRTFRAHVTAVVKAVSVAAGSATGGATPGQPAAPTSIPSPPASPVDNVFSWGDNSAGQLGDGTTANRSTPGLVPGLTGSTSIASGFDFGYALRPDGTVVGWGDNLVGQLDDGTRTARGTPVALQGLSSVAAVAGGFDTGLALRTDGTVWSWGENTDDELGHASSGETTSLGRVGGNPAHGAPLTGITAIAAGFSDGYALRADGTVWSWGSNRYGQLGDGSYTISGSDPPSVDPVEVLGLSGIKQIVAGASTAYALRNDGTVWSWGFDADGELGNGTTGTLDSFGVSGAPVQVLGLNNVTSISAGDYNGYALDSGGRVWSWGYNTDGELGNGTLNFADGPVLTTGLPPVTALRAGGTSAFARASDGSVWAWGNNPSGQLGDGTTTSHPTPERIAALAGAKALQTGDFSTYAILPSS